MGIASTSQMLRNARLSAGLTQARLAERSATSQATLSAYERGHKVPAATTLARILAAAGYRLTAEPARRAVVTPGPAEHERVADTLVDVITLAAALPTAHRHEVGYLPAPGSRTEAVVTLPEKLVAIHRQLAAAGFEHAFGGAIALAYWTLDPRGTSDIDVNVFVPAERCEQALVALPEAIPYTTKDVAAIGRDGQVRLWWERTPIDLFFDYVPLHYEAAKHPRMVPFEGIEIPVLGAVELAVFKAMFDRTRDWADIEAMIAAETLDVDSVRARLVSLAGSEDPRVARLDETLRRVD